LLQALFAGLKVVRSDVGDAPGIGDIGVNADDRDALSDSLVNVGLEDFGACCGEADTGGLLVDDLAEHDEFRVRGVGCGTDEFGSDAERFRRIQKAGLRFLPVGKTDIGGHKNVTFTGFVVGLGT
jgi:hypothetical protein